MGFFSTRSGQGGPEFSVVVGFVLLIFLVVLMTVFQKQSETYDFQVFTDAKRVASILSSNINMISQNGHGYYRYFSVPDTLVSYMEYDVSIAGNFLWLNYTDTTYSVQLITNNVSIIDLVKGDNETNCVSNIYGEIFINGTCVLE